MGYRTFERNDKYQARKGLEGPFTYPNGQVLYYDPKEGKYYDPTTDFYVEYDDVLDLMAMVFTTLSK
jgi:hypothetical protein